MNFIRAGFRTIRANPSLILAEIAWRWAFGAAAWLLVIFTVRTIMEGVDVSAAEIALARSNDAYLIADAIVRVLVQVVPRFLNALLLLVPCLSLIWVFAATFGRETTIVALLREHGQVNRERFWPTGGTQTFFRVFGLNIVRAVFTVATGLAFFGTVVLVSAQIGPGTTPEVAPAYMLAWLFLAFVVGCFWALVNWFLALASIFIVRDYVGVWKALSESVALYRRHTRDYVSIASWFGFFRGAALLVAVIAGLVGLGAGWRAGLIASAVIALLYFAIADTLYIARLAAYVRLAESPATLAVTAGPSVRPEPLGTTPLSETEN